MKKIEQAVNVIRFILKKRKEKVDRMSRRMQPTEAEKIYIGEETELVQNVELLIGEYKKGLDSALGKIPPHDEKLEQTILGAVILESGQEPSPMSRVNFMEAGHFHITAHKIIWQALVEMKNSKTPIDLTTVPVYLRKAGRLEQVGGAYYIALLTSLVSSAANIEYHARVLVEMAIRRELIRSCGDIIYKAYDDNEDALALLDETHTQVNQISKWTKR